MTGTLPPLLDSVVGGGTPERICFRVLVDPMLLCPGKGLVLPKLTIDQIATHVRFLVISLKNNEMSKKSPFAIHRAIIGIGETETCSLTTPNQFAALSTEIQPLVPLPESVPTTSNSEHSNVPEIPQCVKRNSRNRRKCPKVQKPEIEIKMAPHRRRKSAPTEYATDEEDMITYDV
ncbi:hypothetical protein TNCV_539211 [Trichonephila clavipes]|nr:hypothetical protein TNCV_539211 [Trichonephila clavipes]